MNFEWRWLGVQCVVYRSANLPTVSNRQKNESLDQDQDPYQNFTDPENRLPEKNDDRKLLNLEKLK